MHNIGSNLTLGMGGEGGSREIYLINKTVPNELDLKIFNDGVL